MYCKDCGTLVPDGARFCPKCGTEVTAGGSQSPQAEAGSPPAKSGKMAMWKKIVLGFVAIIVLVVSLALFLTGSLVDPVDKQLAALRSGDIDTAYSMTSDAFKKAVSRERFVAFLKANPSLMEITDHSFSTREVGDGIGTLKGTLETKSGSKIPVVYKLVDENGEWKILSITLPKQGVSNN